MHRVPLLGRGRGWACSLRVWLQSPPQSPSEVGAVEVSGRESPLPRHLGSGFPKREALTTHRLGDGICKGSWGLGPGGLGGGEERDRDPDIGWEERRANVQEGKGRETETEKQRDTF